MSQPSRAQRIVDKLLSDERYKQSSVFSERVYRDEPIIRTGRQAYAKSTRSQANAPRRDDPRQTTMDLGDERTPFLRPRVPDVPRTARVTAPQAMPSRYRKMRSLARVGATRARTYSNGASRIFYAQAKYMEDFEDDFEGSCDYLQYFPTYEDMSNYQLRCYFSWRTRLRKGEVSPAPAAFLFLHAYELICGVGSMVGKEGYDELKAFFERYAGTSPAFDVHMNRWMHDYAIYYDVDPALVESQGGTDIIEAVSLIRRAETALLSQQGVAWPDKPLAGLPDPSSVLDALCKLSRYRADKSRFIRDHTDDVAWVAAHVFARMVDHCHKRRKTDYVDGLFGVATLSSYTVFPSAIFYAEKPHADTTYVMSASETYVCQRGFWWRKLPCRKVETNRELGALMHAIDARMRKAMGDNPLTTRTITLTCGKLTTGVTLRPLGGLLMLRNCSS
ncbi:MAG: TerB N-terminal domain-containing protein, partial [Atopobiaceae bacterium]|nr:TerB N-terminal domain-containing protein [Atopobiaceae bacterium]